MTDPILWTGNTHTQTGTGRDGTRYLLEDQGDGVYAFANDAPLMDLFDDMDQAKDTLNAQADAQTAHLVSSLPLALAALGLST